MSRTATANAAHKSNAARSRGRPPMPPEDVALRRSRIIDVASRMFFADGFSETTLEAIGREAGFTKRTIYDLIGDKNALFRAACDTLRLLGPHFELSIPVAGQSVRDVLKHMARQLINHSLDKDLIASERAIMLETKRYPEIVSEVVAQGKITLVETVAAIFDRLAEQGMIAPVDAHLSADIFYDVAVGARGFRAALGHPDEPLSEEELDMRMAMFETGYLRVCAKGERKA
jgi:TetR/AcrR family transcriptional repressor of mexJK operon